MIETHKQKLNQQRTGIGLCISKKIVDSLGGLINCNFEGFNGLDESEENVGSTFTFHIVAEDKHEVRVGFMDIVSF